MGCMTLLGLGLDLDLDLDLGVWIWNSTWIWIWVCTLQGPLLVVFAMEEGTLLFMEMSSLS